MPKQHLITITTSDHGLDFIVHSQEMDRYLIVEDIEKNKPADQHQSVRDCRQERHVQLAEEFRALARKLESGAWPFTRARFDPEMARGASEREIDRLALHIQRLQNGEYGDAIADAMEGTP
jgi:hypothetical protein